MMLDPYVGGKVSNSEEFKNEKATGAYVLMSYPVHPERLNKKPEK